MPLNEFYLLGHYEDNPTIVELKCFLSFSLVFKIWIKLGQWGTLIS